MVRIHRHRIGSLIALGLTVLVVHSVAAQPSPKNNDPTLDDFDQYSTAQSNLSGDPSLSIMAGELLSAALVASTEDKVVTVGFTPFKLRDNYRKLWGWQVTAANDTTTGKTTFGTSFRAEWRWLFERWYADATTKLTARDDDGLEELDRSPIALLPVPTVGANVAVFPVDITRDNQHAIAAYNIVAALSWRLGFDIQADVAVSRGRTRAAVDQERMAGVESASATAVWLIPWLLGIERYDKDYLGNGPNALFQRGLGVGITAEYKRCLEDGADRALCPDGIMDSLFVGGLIDVRAKKGVSPRFLFGRRQFTKFDGTAMDEQSAIEAGVVLSFAIKN